MHNPGLETLLSFLDLVNKKMPATFYDLSRERRKAYGMINRYIKFCLKNGLLEISSEQRRRGPKPSKTYVLTEKGKQLLFLFGSIGRESRETHLNMENPKPQGSVTGRRNPERTPILSLESRSLRRETTLHSSCSKLTSG